VQFAGEGTSGARVLYELGDLQDLVASRKRGSTSDVLAFASNGIESRFHMASGGAPLPADDSDGGAPFFVNASVPGLVLAQCYETNRYLDAWLTDRTIDVAWLNWDEALAAVWEDEPRCQSWLPWYTESAWKSSSENRDRRSMATPANMMRAYASGDSNNEPKCHWQRDPCCGLG
jgi:hypothetical protein